MFRLDGTIETTHYDYSFSYPTKDEAVGAAVGIATAVLVRNVLRLDETIKLDSVSDHTLSMAKDIATIATGALVGLVATGLPTRYIEWDRKNQSVRSLQYETQKDIDKLPTIYGHVDPV